MNEQRPPSPSAAGSFPNGKLAEDYRLWAEAYHAWIVAAAERTAAEEKVEECAEAWFQAEDRLRAEMEAEIDKQTENPEAPRE